MIPQDKFGRIILPSKFLKLKKNEAVLLARGYREHDRKPNLFCREIHRGRFFADMQGTEGVPIWEDTRPLFYWNFNQRKPKWERRRLIRRELIDLRAAGCSCRLSFYALFRTEELSSVSTEVDEENGVYIWDDGYCRFCKKDFFNEGTFCSRECEAHYDNTLKIPCAACDEKIPLFKEVRHHVSYVPEKIVFVHAGCHNVIHKTDRYPHLKPSQEDIVRFYKKNSTAAEATTISNAMQGEVE